MHVQANELELALDVYGQLVREGCTPNLVTYNILIDVYGKTGQWHDAIKVLDALESQVCFYNSSASIGSSSHGHASCWK